MYQAKRINNMEEVRAIASELNYDEISLLYYLLDNVKSGSLLIRDNTTREDIKFRHIAEKLRIDTAYAKKLISKLAKKKIVFWGLNSAGEQFFMNPWLIYKDKVDNPVLQSVIGDYLIRKKGITWDELEERRKKNGKAL